MSPRLSLALALIAATAAAQTTTTPHKTTTTTRRTTTAAKTALTANPADNPPNVPKVEGTPKPLFALRYVDIETGTGSLAEPRKFYTVHYTGWLTNGTKFDSSHDHDDGQPITFPYGAKRVIAGWDTGFEGMHVGGKRRLYIPYQLAYGELGRPPVIPAKADLIFDIELVSQSDAPPEPKPAAAPAKPIEPAKPAEPTNPAAPTPPAGTQTPPPSSQPQPQHN